MISGRQIREGRALLEWSRSDLAECAGIEAEMVVRAEVYEGAPFITVALAGAIRRALEAAGIEFLNDGQPGVRLRLAKQRSDT